MSDVSTIPAAVPALDPTTGLPVTPVAPVAVPTTTTGLPIAPAVTPTTTVPAPTPATVALDPITGAPVAPTAVAPAPVVAPVPAPAPTAVGVPIDPTTGLPVAPAPAVPPVAAAQPTTADLLEAIARLGAEISALKGAAPAANAVTVPANPPSPVNLFSKGQIVRYAWDDPYDGPSERFGLVIDTLPDEGSGAQSRLTWFTAGTSGPIGDHTLTAV